MSIRNRRLNDEALMRNDPYYVSPEMQRSEWDIALGIPNTNEDQGFNRPHGRFVQRYRQGTLPNLINADQATIDRLLADTITHAPNYQAWDADANRAVTESRPGINPTLFGSLHSLATGDMGGWSDDIRNSQSVRDFVSRYEAMERTKRDNPGFDYFTGVEGLQGYKPKRSIGGILGEFAKVAAMPMAGYGLNALTAPAAGAGATTYAIPAQTAMTATPLPAVGSASGTIGLGSGAFSAGLPGTIGMGGGTALGGSALGSGSTIGSILGKNATVKALTGGGMDWLGLAKDWGPTLVGGLLGGSGAGSPSTQTTSTQLPGYMNSALRGITNKAGKLYGKTGMSPDTLMSYDAMRNLYNIPSFDPIGLNQLASTARGDYMLSPEMQNAVLEPALQGVNSAFSSAGRYGSAAHQKALSQGATAALMPYYNAERSRQVSAAQNIPFAQNQMLSNYSFAPMMQNQMGQQQQNYPWDMLKNYSSIVSGQPYGQTQSVTTPGGSVASGILGGALLGNRIGMNLMG